MEDDALVLNSYELGESDLLLNLYCQHSGRLSAIAKGARRSKKRFVNKLEVFSYLHINFSLKNINNPAFLHEAELHTCFPYLRTNYSAFLAASVVQEFLLVGVKDGEKSSDLLPLALWALDSFRQKNKIKTVVTIFLLRYLDYLGYRPQLNYCGKCHRQISPKLNYVLDPENCTLACSACRKIFSSHSLNQGTIKILQTAQDMPLERINRLTFSPRSIIESIHPLYTCSRNILQRDINAWQGFLFFLSQRV